MADTRFNKLVSKRDKHEIKFSKYMLKADNVGNKTISSFTSSASKNVAYWLMTIGAVVSLFLILALDFPIKIGILPFVIPAAAMVLNSVINGVRYLFNKIMAKIHFSGFNKCAKKLKKYGMTKEAAYSVSKVSNFKLEKTAPGKPQKIELFKPTKVEKDLSK